MNINAAGSYNQMQSMYGSGNAQGGSNGMRDIMQSLSKEDRSALKSQMSQMTAQQKQDTINQMKQVEKASMSSQDYAKTLLDIANQQKQTNTTASVTTGFSIYA